MTLPNGFLTKHVSHVEIDYELGRRVIRFNLVVGNGKVERVESSFERLQARLPTVFREDQSIYEISPHQADSVVTEAKRLVAVRETSINKARARASALVLIYRHTHRDYKGTLADGSKTLLTVAGLVSLDSLTDAEIAERLPSAQRKEALRLEAKQGTKV